MVLSPFKWVWTPDLSTSQVTPTMEKKSEWKEINELDNGKHSTCHSEWHNPTSRVVHLVSVREHEPTAVSQEEVCQMIKIQTCMSILSQHSPQKQKC